MGPRFALLLLLTAQRIVAATSCHRSYEEFIGELCLAKFSLDMQAVDQGLWCSWEDTLEPYGSLTNCTYQVALKLGCFWPNQMVDAVFIGIHRSYFQDCALTGRRPHDPPNRILGPFIAGPVVVTLLVTAVVVWRSKRGQGIV
ncbi:receptor activity-modifying protein 1-like [Denticeps clupeoides]|uniref:Receptor activity-modifying protein 1 n=1 Tax=Denticeps clupeoides TaxID=299321 RepID=A0AAY4AE62_9TELE|nr:receptor activity-modifying protein 1-like [Denticeps clupeoides]